MFLFRHLKAFKSSKFYLLYSYIKDYRFKQLNFQGWKNTLHLKIKFPKFFVFDIKKVEREKKVSIFSSDLIQVDFINVHFKDFTISSNKSYQNFSFLILLFYHLKP